MALILFVDDDPMTLALLGKASAIIGHQALLSETGEEALRLAAEKIPDLIFMDMRLYDSDGLDVVRKLRSGKITRKIPVIVLSASQEADSAERSRLAGASTFVRKPIELKKLSDIIQKYVVLQPQFQP